MRTVRPSPQWQDSLIRLESGQRVVIDAEETWSPDMQNQIAWCGADGVYNLPADSGYLLPGANVGALVARIGDDGPIFAVGSRCDFIADQAGPPEFGHERKSEPQQPSRQNRRPNHRL